MISLFSSSSLIRSTMVALCVGALACACTTMETIQNDSPGYVLRYEGVSRQALAECARPRMAALGEKRLVVRQKRDVTIIESYARNLTPVPGSGYMRSNLPLMATHFYDDHVDVFGRQNIQGADGMSYAPLLERCLSELGGRRAG